MGLLKAYVPLVGERKKKRTKKLKADDKQVCENNNTQMKNSVLECTITARYR